MIDTCLYIKAKLVAVKQEVVFGQGISVKS